LNRLYAADYFQHGHHGLDRLETDYESWTDSRIATTKLYLENTILPRRRQSRSLFELGAAMGHFLDAARRAGLRVGGIEVSEHAVAKAREKFQIDVICGDFLEVPVQKLGGPWDIVYAGDVLEHLRKPREVLQRLYHIMARDGLLVVRVPATMNLLATRLAEPALQLARRDQELPDPPYHLYEFTGPTLRMMLESVFERVEVVEEIVPPWQSNLKSGGGGYLLKAALHWVNYPLTRLTGRYGDRLTGFAWRV
jgi:SAM-dependent methyltransferase